MPKPSFSWLLFIIFVSLSSGIVFTGTQYHRAQERHIRETTENVLKSILNLKINQIANWRKERISDAELLVKSPFFIETLEAWIQTQDGHYKTALLKWLRLIKTHYGYYEIIILNKYGKPCLDSQKALSEQSDIDEQTDRLFQQVIASRQVIFSDFYECTHFKGVHIDIMCPLVVHRDSGEELVGAAILRVNPSEFLYPLIQSWPVPSQTSETLLVRRENSRIVFLNELRHQSNTALSFKLPFRSTLPASVAVTTRQPGFIDGYDYRNVRVLAAYAPIPETPWYLIAKTDADEVFEQLHSRARMLIGLSASLILMAGAFVIMIFHFRGKSFYKKLYHLELQQKVIIEHFEYLVRYANDIILLSDEECNIVQANDRAIQAYGYTREEFLRLNLKHLPVCEESDKQKECIADCAQSSGIVYETIHQRKNGSVFPVEISLNIIEIDGKKYYQDIIRDITERKQAENALKESEARLKEAQRIGRIGSWELDIRSNRLVWSDEIYQIFEIDAATFKASYEAFLDAVHPDDRELVNRTYMESLKTRQPYSLTHRLQMPDGRIKYVHEQCESFFDADGAPIRSIGTVQDITERRLAEERLRELSDRLILATQAAGIGIWDWDLKINVLVWDDQMYRLYDVKPDEFSWDYDTWRSRVHPDEIERVENEIQAAIAGEKKFITEFRILLPDQRVRFLNAYAIVQKDADGTPVRMLGINSDITERKLSEQRLQEVLDFNQKIIQAAAIGVIVYKASGPCVLANEAVGKIINTTVENLLAQNFHQIESWKKSGLYEMATKVLNEQVPQHGEFHILTSFGKDIWAACYLNTFNIKGEPHLLLMINDITDRKRAERALKESEERWKFALEGSGQGIWDWNALTNEVFFSERWKEMLGYSGDEISNRLEEWEKRVHPEDLPKVYQELQKHIDGLTPFYQNQHRMRCKDGRYKWILDRGIVLSLGHDGKPLRLIGTQTDISEQKKAEEALIEAKEASDRANRAKSEFLANMSHEIRTPMNAILGFAELLKGHVADPKYANYIDGILSGGKTLLSLINDILDLSKIEAGRMELTEEPTDIHRLLQDFKIVFSVKEAEKNLKFLIEMTERVPKFVIIDEVRIRQMLFNLLGNAFKFTDRGFVKLKADGPMNPNDNSHIELFFEVSDSGIGIPKDQQEAVFEAFRQQDGQSSRKYGGTGLGLTITRRLAEMMNGRIELESEPGKGSTFRIIIPNVKVAVGTIELDKSEPQGIQDIRFTGNPVILLAEDIESNREIVKGYLENTNAVLIDACNGEEAVNMAQRIKPDAILMDMMMPVMDGYEAIKTIRKNELGNPTDTSTPNSRFRIQDSKVPIIALTASSMSRDEHLIRGLCDDYLRKPVKRSDLLMSLCKFLPYQGSSSPSDSSSHPPQANALAANRLAPDQMERLKTQFMSRWESIAGLMSNDDILQFANELIEYAKTIDSKPLEDYARMLCQDAESFDIERMEKRFREFPKQIEGLA